VQNRPAPRSQFDYRDATITRVHKSTARVSFLLARTRDGRPYQDELLPLSALRTLDAE